MAIKLELGFESSEAALPNSRVARLTVSFTDENRRHALHIPYLQGWGEDLTRTTEQGLCGGLGRGTTFSIPPLAFVPVRAEDMPTAAHAGGRQGSPRM